MNLIRLNMKSPKFYSIHRDMINNKYYFQYRNEPMIGPYRTRFEANIMAKSDAIEKNEKNKMIETYILERQKYKLM